MIRGAATGYSVFTVVAMGVLLGALCEMSGAANPDPGAAIETALGYSSVVISVVGGGFDLGYDVAATIGDGWAAVLVMALTVGLAAPPARQLQQVVGRWRRAP